MERATADAAKKIAARIRGDVIEMIYRSEGAHLGGALSCVDLLVGLYWHCLNVDPISPTAPGRDRLIFSKGHAISALYAVLARQGFFGVESLQTYNLDGSDFPEHPSPGSTPGVEWATGSLGHGLGVGIGMALGLRVDAPHARVYVVMSDGECQEGSVWEAALFAGRNNLQNLVVIVDFNKWQATGRSCEIMQLEPLAEKFRSFGWSAIEIDGHSMEAIYEAYDQASRAARPVCIVAHTVKGKGVSFIEDDNNWHYRAPNAQELEQARMELGLI